jgi:hypothetical protein
MYKFKQQFSLELVANACIEELTHFNVATGL